MSNDRTYRLEILVALAVKNNQTPTRNTFVGFTHRVLTSKFQSSPQVMRNDTQTLVSAWSADHWRSLIQDNPYLTSEEVTAWTQNH
jgi:hypothetical protein